MSKKTDRRDFLMQSTLAGLSLKAASRSLQARTNDSELAARYDAGEGFRSQPLEVVRIGFVGVGLQGGSHVKNFLNIEGVEVTAVCDIDASRAKEVASWVQEAGYRPPRVYSKSDTDFLNLCDQPDVDLVFNSTPWNWHVPVAVAAMKSGKHSAIEVPAATTIDGCWELVETAETTRRHCVMMENCCYGRREMMILQMVRAGLFGDLLHAEAAYIHDLRSIKFSDANEGLWRLAYSVTRNANLYPTHGLGPVAQCLDINRGDQFDHMVSMSSPAKGLKRYAKRELSPEDPRRNLDFALGDMNTSLIKTKLGRSIVLQHDTASPRPYSRINLVQGTAGTVTGYPDRVHIEGKSPAHEWEDLASYREQWDHPLWVELERQAEGAGHGGMDYLEDYRLIQALRFGQPMDMDVYDAAAWSAPIELSERSVASRSRTIDFPDFTRGRWRHRPRLAVGGVGRRSEERQAPSSG